MTCRCEPVEMVPYSAFQDQVRLSIPAAPADVIDFAVRNAVIEMVKESLQMQRDIYVDVQECVCDYEICIPGMVLHAVREVHFHRRELHPITSPTPYVYSGQYYHEPEKGILIGDQPGYDSEGALYVRAVVHPSRDSCEVDRWVYERHADAVAEGALSRLFGMKDMSWFDRAEAGVAMRRFKTAKNRMKGEQAKHRISGPTFMSARRFV